MTQFSGIESIISTKYPRLVIMKVTNGFLVCFFPENQDLQKIMETYMKQIMQMIQTADGDEWKSKVQQVMAESIKATGNNDLIYICADAIEVMKLIAPGEHDKKGKKKVKDEDNYNRPDLSVFWEDKGHIPS